MEDNTAERRPRWEGAYGTQHVTMVARIIIKTNMKYTCTACTWARLCKCVCIYIYHINSFNLYNHPKE